MRNRTIEYLAISHETDSVVASGFDLEEVTRDAMNLGYTDGFVTNQDGGRESLESLIDRFRLEVSDWKGEG